MAKRRTSGARLVLTVLVSVFLFVGLALAEDYGRKFWDGRRADQAKAGRDAAAAAAVGRYAEALAEAYIKGSPAVLEKANVATEKQVAQVRLYMAYNHFEKKQKLLAELKEQNIGDIKVAGGKATVAARENWLYAYADEATAKIVSSSNQAVRVDYKLVKRDGDWLVDDLAADTVGN